MQVKCVLIKQIQHCIITTLYNYKNKGIKVNCKSISFINTILLNFVLCLCFVWGPTQQCQGLLLALCPGDWGQYMLLMSKPWLWSHTRYTPYLLYYLFIPVSGIFLWSISSLYCEVVLISITLYFNTHFIYSHQCEVVLICI